MAKKKKDLPTRPAGGMAIAARWPIYESLLSNGWDKEGALTTALVARRSPTSGKIAAALFLVDLACLGVKSAQVKMFKTPQEYADLRAHAFKTQPMAPADINLVAKIILTGVEYAASLGFKPDPVFAQAAPLLDAANPDANPTPVPTGGKEGKPFFVVGPYDDPQRVIAQLTRAVGEGNFHFLVPMGGDFNDDDVLLLDDGR